MKHIDSVHEKVDHAWEICSKSFPLKKPYKALSKYPMRTLDMLVRFVIKHSLQSKVLKSM